MIAPKRAYFRVFTLQSKKRKEEVKQAPEKTSKESKIMEDISKSLQSTPTSDNLFGMLVAAEIKNLSPKRKIKLEINNLLFKYQEDNDAAASSTTTSDSDTTFNRDMWQYKQKSIQHLTERTMAI